MADLPGLGGPSLTFTAYLPNIDNMSRTWGVKGTAAKSTAIEECEMILGHLKGYDGDNIDPDFLRVHSVSLLQLIGEIGRAEVPPIMRSEGDDLSFLFRGGHNPYQRF